MPIQSPSSLTFSHCELRVEDPRRALEYGERWSPGASVSWRASP